MGVIGKNFKYKLIKNFITKEEISLLGHYCEIKHITNTQNFDEIQSNVCDTFFYGDPVMDSLMIKYKNKISKITGKEVLPTYAFWRMYTKGATLKKHKDRPSCEISVTVCLSNDKTKWPIYMEGKPMILKPGDGVIYLGCELEHWREAFEGDYQAQAFLHYVDKNGPHKDHFMDKRLFWGLQKG
jgi:hypothetical protein|tara:strand:+ start:1361 stop:1912 length:552 start_codon:yes stop_codon:yes gene_type:complete